MPGQVPPDARNVSLIPGSVAYYFSSPPDRLTDLYDYTLAFDIERGVTLTEATSPPYSESGWPAPSTDVADFKAHGGKMIFFHGMADPIFSANDTVAYLNGLAQRFGSVDFRPGYLVPGMNHCAGGPASDQTPSAHATTGSSGAWRLGQRGRSIGRRTNQRNGDENRTHHTGSGGSMQNSATRQSPVTESEL